MILNIFKNSILDHEVLHSSGQHLMQASNYFLLSDSIYPQRKVDLLDQNPDNLISISSKIQRYRKKPIGFFFIISLTLQCGKFPVKM